MDLPQEVIVWYLLPALRKELVLEMKNFKLSQKDIAKKLNITEAAISQYMHNKRASTHMKISEPVKKEIKKAALRIKNSDEKNASQKELVKLVNLSCKEKVVCNQCMFGNEKCDLCRQ